MQYSDEKTKRFAKVLGEVIGQICREKKIKSINNFANQYDLDDSNLNKILNGKYNTKLVTLWRISEALGVKCSDVILLLEEKLDKEFTFIDE